MPILSSEEKAAVEELRLRMKTELSQEKLSDENMFYRFLKARDFKLDLAEAMLRKNIAWRKANQVDTILTDYKPPEVLKKHLCHNHIGFDKDGWPIIYTPLGRIHYEGIFKSIKEAELPMYIVYELENIERMMKEQSERIGKEIYQIHLIFDYSDLTIAKATNKQNLQAALTCLMITNAHYPERLKAVYVINVPVFFNIFYSLVKPFIPEVVLQKVKIFGSDGFQEELLKSIHADVLPAFLGGRRTDPEGNPLCNTFISHGPEVPERYYKCNSKTTPMYQRVDAIKLLIPALSKRRVEINVDQYDHGIEWEYETKHGDIGFGLFYRENCNDTSKEEELIPVHKVHSCDGSETGMFRCKNLGTYILVFDNSFSYFYQKELYYTLATKKLLDM